MTSDRIHRTRDHLEPGESADRGSGHPTYVNSSGASTGIPHDDEPSQGSKVNLESLSPASANPGDWIDKYEVLEQIGEGACGIVFRVRQSTPLRRELALKVLKPGMDSRKILARFRTEHRSLALMRHPGIASVFDAGITKAGLPYFVMELVQGKSLVEYCHSNALNVEQRLRVFSKVCNAVQHAHSNGIVHRDLKPQNILVDGEPPTQQLKVIDFGVAQWFREDSSETTIHTTEGELLGTPQYMSPEQLAGDHAHVDSRSDVYSLGIMLHELLTGEAPRRDGWNDSTLVDRDTAPGKRFQPLRIVERIVGASAQIRTQAGPHCGPERRHSAETLRGELEWIVLKAIEPKPDRRYETARGLREDIERYLSGEPVAARPPSLVYLFGKRLQRSRMKWLVRFAYVAVFALFLVAISLLYRDAEFRYRVRKLKQLQARANAPWRPSDQEGQERLYQDIYALQRELLGEEDLATIWTQLQIVKSFSSTGRHRRAVELGEETLAQLREKLGDTAPYTHIGTLELVNSYINALPKCVNPNADHGVAELELVPQRVERALALCDRLEGYVPTHRMMLLLHLTTCYAIQGDRDKQEQTLASLDTTGYLKDFGFWPRGILHQTQGRPEAARQCLHVIQDRGARWFFDMPRDGWLFQYCRDMNTWTCEYLGLPRAWTCEDPPPPDLLQTYSDLLNEYPADPTLLFGRGINWIRAGDWRQAANDFRAVIGERPDVFECWEALTVAQLQLNNSEMYRSACQQVVQRFGYFPELESRLLCLSALAPQTALSQEQLAHHLQELTPNTPFDYLAQAWVQYRLGWYEKALNTVPSEGDPLTLCVGPLIQAMALQQLGKEDAARDALARAQRQIANQIPSVTGPPIANWSLPERPLCRAIVEITLAEAEGVIGQRAADTR